MKFDWEIARLILLNYEYSEIDRTTEENLSSSLVEKGGADVEFADGKKHFVHGNVAHKVLNAMEKMKPAQRAEAQKGIHQSHAHLMAVHKMLSR